MAKTSVYLPNDLAEQARAYGIPISEVAQAAVRQAVRAARIKESAMTDISAVAERLNETRMAATEERLAIGKRTYEAGVEWARQTATAAELEYVATYDGPAGEYRMPATIYNLVMTTRAGSSISAWASEPTGPASDRWEFFQAGAREVWDMVCPLLAEMDEGEPA
jgi:post-segregation antitoxin (ccd killing protein)